MYPKQITLKKAKFAAGIVTITKAKVRSIQEPKERTVKDIQEDIWRTKERLADLEAELIELTQRRLRNA
jgi:hypothetical protein